jgi:DNA (cytosine-5)-methyltransferase 1
MKILDLFSGIGAFSLAAQHNGMSVIAHSEIDANCQKLLARRFPDVPQLGDITKVKTDDISETIDLVCGVEAFCLAACYT